MKHKHLYLVMAIIFLAVLCLTSCSKNGDSSTNPPPPPPPKILTSIDIYLVDNGLYSTDAAGKIYLAADAMIRFVVSTYDQEGVKMDANITPVVSDTNIATTLPVIDQLYGTVKPNEFLLKAKASPTNQWKAVLVSAQATKDKVTLVSSQTEITAVPHLFDSPKKANLLVKGFITDNYICRLEQYGNKVTVYVSIGDYNGLMYPDNSFYFGTDSTKSTRMTRYYGQWIDNNHATGTWVITEDTIRISGGFELTKN